MNILETIALGAFALLPVVVLLVITYKKDKVEKEPIWLIIVLILAGCAICVPAIFLENALTLDRVSFSSDEGYFLYDAFVVAALSEEALKWIAMLLITKWNKNFNCLFDGIMYAVCVSLGFAGLENVLYVVHNGWATGVTRMVLAVPGHMLFGVFMGAYYSYWHIGTLARKKETEYMQMGILEKGSSKVRAGVYGLVSLILPILLHGTYDFFAFDAYWIGIIIFMILLYIFGFKMIGKFSKADVIDHRYAFAVLNKVYPGLSDKLEKIEYAAEENGEAAREV